MDTATILSLILGSATSLVGLMLAVRSFITNSQKKAVRADVEARTLADLVQRVEKLEQERDKRHD